MPCRMHPRSRAAYSQTRKEHDVPLALILNYDQTWVNPYRSPASTIMKKKRLGRPFVRYVGVCVRLCVCLSLSRYYTCSLCVAHAHDMPVYPCNSALHNWRNAKDQATPEGGDPLDHGAELSSWRHSRDVKFCQWGPRASLHQRVARQYLGGRNSAVE